MKKKIFLSAALSILAVVTNYTYAAEQCPPSDPTSGSGRAPFDFRPDTHERHFASSFDQSDLAEFGGYDPSRTSARSQHHLGFQSQTQGGNGTSSDSVRRQTRALEGIHRELRKMNNFLARFFELHETANTQSNSPSLHGDMSDDEESTTSETQSFSEPPYPRLPSSLTGSTNSLIYNHPEPPSTDTPPFTVPPIPTRPPTPAEPDSDSSDLTVDGEPYEPEAFAGNYESYEPAGSALSTGHRRFYAPDFLEEQMSSHRNVSSAPSSTVDDVHPVPLETSSVTPSHTTQQTEEAPTLTRLSSSNENRPLSTSPSFTDDLISYVAIPCGSIDRYSTTITKTPPPNPPKDIIDLSADTQKNPNRTFHAELVIVPRIDSKLEKIRTVRSIVPHIDSISEIREKKVTKNELTLQRWDKREILSMLLELHNRASTNNSDETSSETEKGEETKSEEHKE